MAFKKQARKLNTNLNKFSMLHFGKHKGKTCEEVCNIDPEYILWLGREPHITLHPDLQVLAEECAEWDEPFVCNAGNKGVATYIKYVNSKGKVIDNHFLRIKWDE